MTSTKVSSKLHIFAGNRVIGSNGQIFVQNGGLEERAIETTYPMARQRCERKSQEYLLKGTCVSECQHSNCCKAVKTRTSPKLHRCLLVSAYQEEILQVPSLYQRVRDFDSQDQILRIIYHLDYRSQLYHSCYVRLQQRGDPHRSQDRNSFPSALHYRNGSQSF